MWQQGDRALMHWSSTQMNQLRKPHRCVAIPGIPYNFLLPSFMGFSCRIPFGEYQSSSHFLAWDEDRKKKMIYSPNPRNSFFSSFFPPPNMSPFGYLQPHQSQEKQLAPVENTIPQSRHVIVTQPSELPVWFAVIQVPWSYFDELSFTTFRLILELLKSGSSLFG